MADKKARKPKTKAPENETKADKFKRLGTARLNRTLSTINGMEKLCTSAYEWTPEQAEVIVKALRSSVDSLETRLAGKKAEKITVAL